MKYKILESYKKQYQTIVLTTIVYISSVVLTHILAQDIYIDNTTQKQYISMMGCDMERSGRNFLNVINQQEVINWLVKDTPVNTWRVRYDKLQEMEEGVKDFSTYEGEILAMKMMLEVNPDIKFFATMKSDYHGYSEGNRNNLPVFIYDYWYDAETESYYGTKNFDTQKYAVFLADYLEYMQQQNVPISYLSTSKEWRAVFTVERVKEILNFLITELEIRNVNMPLIVDPGSWSITQGIKTIKEYQQENINELVFGYCSHNYWSKETKTWYDFVEMAKLAGKHTFQDETGTAAGPATYEVDFTRALDNYSERLTYFDAGIEGELFFEVWPRGYNPVESTSYFSRPVFFRNNGRAYRMRSYYLMQKFIETSINTYYYPSWQENNTVNPSLKTNVFATDDKLNIWVVNHSNISYDQLNFNLENNDYTNNQMLIEQTTWTEDSNIQGDKQDIHSNGNHKFTASIPKKSIHCFTLNKQFNIDLSYFINNTEIEVNSLDRKIKVNQGDNLTINAQISLNRKTWLWSGPNSFSSDKSSISLDNIQPYMSGTYNCKLTNWLDNQPSVNIDIEVSCNNTEETLSTYYKINDESWIHTNGNTTIFIEKNNNIKLETRILSGSYYWLHNNIKYKDISLEKIAVGNSGIYTLVYTSDEGCTQYQNFEIIVNCTDTPNLTFYSKINELNWTKENNLSVAIGDKVKFGPQSNNQESYWSYTGPNNFKYKYVREVTIDSITPEHLGEYELKRIDPYECENNILINLTLKEDNTLSNISPNLETIKEYKITSTNPFSDSIDLKFKENQNQVIELYSLKGKLISKNKLQYNHNTININTSNYVSGLYILKIINDKKQTYYYEKLIK